AAFGSEGAIITNAGGCGAMLETYGHLFANDEALAEAAANFSKRVRDVSQQLQPGTAGVTPASHANAGLVAPQAGRLRSQVQTPSLPRVTYDTSCHLVYGQHAGDASQQMLRCAVGPNFVPLEGTERCCGAAGIYNLLQPEMSGRVLQEKLRHI